MLTKDLLDVEKRRPNVRPRYRDPAEWRPTAEDVLATYEPGRTRGTIADAVGDLETHETFKLVRGLSKLLDRRATFEQRVPAGVPPDRVRGAVYDRGPVTDEAERDAVLAAVAERFDTTPAAIEESLWADRERNEVLSEAPDVDPASLLRQYNLSLTQTLLFDAVELSFSVSDNYQEVFGLVTYLGLMYTVDEDLTVTVTGPAALFEQTRKYGTELAKLVPAITRAEQWAIEARVETDVGGQSRIYEFEVDSERADLFPADSAVPSYDSDLERDFAARIEPLAQGWTVTREPTIIRAGNRVMIPDFGFERDGDEFSLEVVGFWTPEYLEEKLEKARELESEHPVVLAVDEDLNCAERDFADANVDEVIFFEDRVPVDPVLDRLQHLDAQATERDRERLAERDLQVPDDEVTDVEARARQEGVRPAALEAHLTEEFGGVVSNDRFVPGGVLEDIEAEIDALEGNSLAEVNEVLDAYGVAQGILEAVGYSVEYVSLDQSEARVRKME